MQKRQSAGDRASSTGSAPPRPCFLKCFMPRSEQRIQSGCRAERLLAGGLVNRSLTGRRRSRRGLRPRPTRTNARANRQGGRWPPSTQKSGPSTNSIFVCSTGKTSIDPATRREGCPLQNTLHKRHEKTRLNGQIASNSNSHGSRRNDTSTRWESPRAQMATGAPIQFTRDPHTSRWFITLID